MLVFVAWNVSGAHFRSFLWLSFVPFCSHRELLYLIVQVFGSSQETQSACFKFNGFMSLVNCLWENMLSIVCSTILFGYWLRVLNIVTVVGFCKWLTYFRSKQQKRAQLFLMRKILKCYSNYKLGFFSDVEFFYDD